ncbi:pyridoxamine 5'-phosphate oxidase family protein [Patulibacter minatonensis]|uniref:pyridoxamine 5'-phosphate oxidase family protein n=1 Tax=Patulibacter minatonensis TaxID=298163 RepID=UPI0004790EB7|nr:pyridoxamine 5'-phosphate oxidase family protein [Patulibacter minatonensis]
MTFAFHPGELEVQRRAGEDEVAARVARSIREDVPDVAAAFLEAQPFVVIATTDDTGHPVASLLSGPPGVVRVAGDRTLVLDRLPPAGDPVTAALGRPSAEVGLIAIEPATRRRVRINGAARRESDRVLVTTGQVFSNCPKYISTREPDHADLATPPGPRRDTDVLTDEDRRLLEGTDALFLASTNVDAGVDVSHRGGNPGFVTVTGPTSLSFPDYQGNSMFMTLGNLTVDPRVGLLVVDWATGDLLQLQGTATIDWSPERAATIPGARRVVDVALTRVTHAPGASPLRWGPRELSRFNP